MTTTKTKKTGKKAKNSSRKKKSSSKNPNEKKSGTNPGFWSKTCSTAKSGLEEIVQTGLHAAYAANPVQDFKNYAHSAYKLASEKPDLEEYKENFKKGKFLGKGNLSTVLFGTGAVLSGLYPSLLALRAAVGAGTYIGKEILTNEKVKNYVSSLAEKISYIPSALGQIAGIPYQKTKDALSKNNLEKCIENLEDNDYYREKVFPFALEAAIGMLGYGGLVGLKWGASLASKGAEKIKEYSTFKPVQWLGKGISKISNIVKNAASDVLSASIFTQGVLSAHDSSAVKFAKGEYNKDIKHVATEEFKEDAKEYVASGEIIKDAGKAVYDAGSFVCGKSAEAAGNAKDFLVYTLGGGLTEDIAELMNIENVKERGNGFIEETYYDAADAFGINESENYALIIAGYNDYENEFILAEQAQAYHKLVEMGVPEDHIYVLTPDGYFPNSYLLNSIEGAEAMKQALEDPSYNHDASEDNIKNIIKELSEKVDGNDNFMMYVTAHGNTSFDENGHLRSYFGVSNGDEKIYDNELRDMVKDIEGGLELYLVEACHSGTFAEELSENENEIVISSSRANEVAWTNNRGEAVGKYFMDELAARGNLKSEITRDDIIECLAEASKKFKENHFLAKAYDQRPVVGYREEANAVAA